MNKKNDSVIATPLSERILALDVLRGIAVLGILVMNIQSYSMPSAAYLNPTAYGDLTGLNKWIWIVSHLFTDQKFITLFSLLFGAGIILFIGRLEKKEQPGIVLHYRRIFWLFVLGLAHAYLLWYGDILVTYAICAGMAVLMRSLSAKILLPVGMLLIAVPSLLYFFFGLSWDFMPPEAQQGILRSWRPSAEMIAQQINTYRGDYLQQMTLRIPEALNFQTFIFLINTGWRTAGLMLIGMALFKWRIITAERSVRFYLILSIICFFSGGFMVVSGLKQNFAANWVVDYSMFIGSQYNYWGSLFISCAYLSWIMIWLLYDKLTWFALRLAAVGRMAFSNYLLQSVICTIIFYGHGFALYGELERSSQFVIVFVIWLIQLIISPLWLRHFRFGPAEWLWRTLTYWKVQPFRI